jgi:SAM-dependent methyltransferase
MKFEYRNRTHCICGGSLDASPSCIVKKGACGNVYFARCAACGSYMQSPQITTESLSKWYDSDEYQGGSGQNGSAYVNYEQDEQARIYEARGRFCKHIAPLLPRNASILEIGCATGSLLSVIKGFGHKTLGIDLSPRFAEAARHTHDLDVIAGDFMTLALKPESFDAIILLGTASNMQDLPSAINKIQGLLKDNGFLMFNFPRADSLIAKAYGQRYWMFAPSVSNFMTVAGCLKMLEQTQLTVTSISADTQQPSLGKLLHHSKLDRLIPRYFEKWTNRPIPFALPIPAVTLVRATKSRRVTNAKS